MFTTKWIISLITSTAKKSPLMAVIIVLLIGIAVVWPILDAQYKARIGDMKSNISALSREKAKLEAQNVFLHDRMEYKDSLYAANMLYLQQKTSEDMRQFMTKINQEQADQLKKNEEIRKVQTGILSNNQRMIKKSHSAIQNLSNVK